MTSSNGNIFRVTGHLCGGFTGPPWIPTKKTSDAELCCFSLICARIDWVYNGEAGDLRRHRAHYDITVMRHHGRCFVTDLCDHTNCLRECLVHHKCGANSTLSIQTWPLWISVKGLKHSHWNEKVVNQVQPVTTWVVRSTKVVTVKT